MPKTKILSLNKNDFKIDTFTVPGPGGGGKDTSNTGVRITHIASGAVGEGREERRQSSNKERAFKKMAASPKFQQWVKFQVAKLKNELETPEQIMARIDRMIEEGISNGSIKVEYYENR